MQPLSHIAVARPYVCVWHRGSCASERSKMADHLGTFLFIFCSERHLLACFRAPANSRAEAGTKFVRRISLRRTQPACINYSLQQMKECINTRSCVERLIQRNLWTPWPAYILWNSWLLVINSLTNTMNQKFTCISATCSANSARVLSVLLFLCRVYFLCFLPPHVQIVTCTVVK